MESPGFLPTTLGGEVTLCIIGPGLGDWPTYPTYPAAPVLVPQVVPQQHTHYHLAPTPRLSDEDVDRIAKRVAELLREKRDG